MLSLTTHTKNSTGLFADFKINIVFQPAKFLSNVFILQKGAYNPSP